MTVQTNPKAAVSGDAFMGMEHPICNIQRVARVLIHMSNSDHGIEGQEIGWLGEQMSGIGRELEALYYKAHEDRRGAPDEGSR